jgi:hypothetical protein
LATELDGAGTVVVEVFFNQGDLSLACANKGKQGGNFRSS